MRALFSVAVLGIISWSAPPARACGSGSGGSGTSYSLVDFANPGVSSDGHDYLVALEEHTASVPTGIRAARASATGRALDGPPGFPLSLPAGSRPRPAG